MGQSPSYEANSQLAGQKILLLLWNLKGLLPCKQKPTTGPYSEAEDFSPNSHILFF